MALRDKLALFRAQIPVDAIMVPVEVGAETLELRVSRRDVSPASEKELFLFDRQMRQQLGVEDEEDGAGSTIVTIETVAKRMSALSTGYRIYPSAYSQAEIDAVEWEAAPSDEDLLSLGFEVFNSISSAVFGKLYPNTTGKND